MHPALLEVEHRPWSLPSAPWVLRQSWLELAFLHWAVPVSAVRSLVPPGLEVQEREGSTWIGVVPFRMHGVMARGLPDVPGVSAFWELNVRLYVARDGKPGVWFLSLDASNELAVWGGRTLFHLPYFRASVRAQTEGDATAYTSLRAGPVPARYQARHRPLGEEYRAAPGSLDHWLTERYCLYAATPSGALQRTEVHHAPWPLRRGEVEIVENTLLDAHGIRLSGAPLCHVTRGVDVVTWWPRSCGVG